MFPEVYRINLLKQHESGFALDPVTITYLARIASNGGTISESSTSNFNDFVLNLRSAGLLSKIRRLNPILGNDEAALRTPAIANVGNNQDIDLINSSSWSETTGLSAPSSNVDLGSGLNADVEAIVPSSNCAWAVYVKDDANSLSRWASEPSTSPARATLSLSTQRGNTSLGAILITGQGSSVSAFYSAGSAQVKGYLQTRTKYNLSSPAGSVETGVHVNGVKEAEETGGTASGGVYTETTRPIQMLVVASSPALFGYVITEYLDDTESTSMAMAWENFQVAMGRSAFA